MANHKSAKKRARQNQVRKERNKAQRSNVRTFIKKLYQTIKTKDHAKASELLLSIQSLLGKLTSKGILNRKTAARYTSRMAAKVNGLAIKGQE
ncbi:MAG: 30S ribosomal protein S20 [Halobacteriovoraceae bacterium]|nr:30S ribosomal protein S20 [Halobacteriovoraceae bacterium]